MAGVKVELPLSVDHGGEAVVSAARVHLAERQIDPNAGRQSQHRRPASAPTGTRSRTAATRISSRAGTVGRALIATGTRRTSGTARLACDHRLALTLASELVEPVLEDVLGRTVTLEQGGAATVSLRAAAELAGVSHAAPYRHFRDKNALVAAVGEEGFRLLTAEMRAAIEGCTSKDVLARIRAAGRGYVSFAIRCPAHFRTMFDGGAHSDPENQSTKALRAAGEEAYAVLQGLVEEGIRCGRLRSVNPHNISLAAWSLIHGLSVIIVGGQLNFGSAGGVGAPGIHEIVDKVMRLLEGGLAR